MNRLTPEKRVQILHMLCEGSSIRAITRVPGASKNTVAKLLADVGQACSEYQYTVFNELPCKRIQVDEIWSFVYAKQANVKSAKAAPKAAGVTNRLWEVADIVRVLKDWEMQQEAKSARTKP